MYVFIIPPFPSRDERYCRDRSPIADHYWIEIRPAKPVLLCQSNLKTSLCTFGVRQDSVQPFCLENDSIASPTDVPRTVYLCSLNDSLLLIPDLFRGQLSDSSLKDLHKVGGILNFRIPVIPLIFSPSLSSSHAVVSNLPRWS